MNLRAVRPLARKTSIPRVSGDEPYLFYSFMRPSVYSPRERG